MSVEQFPGPTPKPENNVPLPEEAERQRGMRMENLAKEYEMDPMDLQSIRHTTEKTEGELTMITSAYEGTKDGMHFSVRKTYPENTQKLFRKLEQNSNMDTSPKFEAQIGDVTLIGVDASAFYEGLSQVATRRDFANKHATHQAQNAAALESISKVIGKSAAERALDVSFEPGSADLSKPKPVTELRFPPNAA
jgi:hypothetical protein